MRDRIPYVGLLSSFQRPSFAPRYEIPALVPSPDRRGVAKTTVLRQGWGGVSTSAVPVCQEEVRSSLRAPLRPREVLISLASRPRQAFARDLVAASGVRGAFLPPHRAPRQPPGDSLRRRWSGEGAASTLSPEARQEEPGTTATSFLLRPARGGSCRPRRAPLGNENRPRCHRAGPPRSAGSRLLAPQAARCQPRSGASSQARTSTAPRRQRAATASAATSRPPASRARSCAEMAAMRASASSTRSFTTT